MPGADKATARTVTVIVLLLLAAVALRGHLPGAETAPAEPAEPGIGPLIAVVVMLALSVAVIAVSIVSQSRHRTRLPGTTEGPPRDRDGAGTPWTWRTVLIVAAALLLWLLVVLALMRVSGWLELAADQPAAPSSGPRPPSGADPAPPRSEPGGSDPVLRYLFWAAAAFVVLSVVAATVRRRRRRPGAAVSIEAADPPVSGTQTLARAAERGLVAIGDLSREPREAIIACYAAMEHELGRSPGAMPLDSDTPSEVLARAVDVELLRGDSAAELVDLFEEARFSVHVMGEEHRAAAVRVLQLVLRELQDAA